MQSYICRPTNRADLLGEAALKLVSSLRRNQSLTDLRLDNQRHIFGAKVEQEFSKVLKHNKSVSLI